MAQDVTIDIKFKLLEDINKKVGKIEKSFDSLEKQTKQNNFAFKNMAISLTGINQGLELVGKAFNVFGKVLKSVNRVVKESIDLAGVQEKQEFLLAAALKQKGIFTEELYRRNLQYASSLQELSVFGDEQILQAQKAFIQFGIEQDQVEALTKATLDLAAAKGMDLVSAADLLARSVGSSTNALSRYGIQIEGAAGSTGRAQAAVEAINRIFGGTSQAEVNTYTGAVSQLSNTYGDFLEKIGNLIIKNPFVLSSIKKLNKFFQELQGFIAKNTVELQKFVNDGLIFLAEKVVGLAKFVNNVTKVGLFSAIFGKDAKQRAEEIKEQISIIEDKISELNRTSAGFNLSNSFTGVSLIADNKKEVAQLNSEIAELNKELERLGEGSGDSLISKLDGFLDRLKKISSASVGGGIAASGKQIQKSLGQKITDSIIDGFKKGVTFFSNLGVGGLATAIKGGRGGAQKLASGAVGAAFGPQAAAVFDLFSQSTEQFRQSLNGFIDFFVELPTVLAENVDYFIQRLVEKAPEITTALSEAMPIVASRLAALLSDPKFWLKVGQAFAESVLIYLSAGIIDSFKPITDAFSSAVNIFEDVINGLKNAVGGGVVGGAVGGGVGSVIGSIGGALGFAEGGDVPNLSQFRNDGLPAKLSAGESVLTKSTTDLLRDFLTNQDSASQNVVVNLQVGEQDLANVMFDLNRKGFRTA